MCACFEGRHTLFAAYEDTSHVAIVSHLYAWQNKKDMKTPLLGMTLAELKEVARSLGMPAFTGGQIAK